jgi:hypothetical protein
MFVIKRGMRRLPPDLSHPALDGRRERVLFDKITSRISKLCYGLNMNFVDPIQVTQKVLLTLFVLEH